MLVQMASSTVALLYLVHMQAQAVTMQAIDLNTTYVVEVHWGRSCINVTLTRTHPGPRHALQRMLLWMREHPQAQS
jgi:hypothetical protein